mgnify:CR=1 FL=1
MIVAPSRAAQAARLRVRKKVNPQDVAIHQFLGQVKHKFIVMSGKGGVGKSTVSVDLALLLAEKGFKVGLLDVDLHGPSVAGMLGFSNAHLMAKKDRLLPFEVNKNLCFISAQGLLQSEDDPLIWRGLSKLAPFVNSFPIRIGRPLTI